MTGLQTWTCGQCNTVQAMPAETMRVLRASSATFYCVHGHARHYPQGKSVEKKLREELDAERRRRQQSEQSVAYWQDERERESRRARAFKGQVTRLRNRAAAGVCPCCNRHFANLQRHVASKHPDFRGEAPEPALRVVEGGRS